LDDFILKLLFCCQGKKGQGAKTQEPNSVASKMQIGAVVLPVVNATLLAATSRTPAWSSASVLMVTV
jgi:hypothetical protein